METAISTHPSVSLTPTGGPGMVTGLIFSPYLEKVTIPTLRSLRKRMQMAMDTLCGMNTWQEPMINPASSVPDTSPVHLRAVSSLTIAENQPVGTIVGEFNATDPDTDAILTYTLVGGANDNHYFTIDANGTLRSAYTYDYEHNQSFSIQAKGLLIRTTFGPRKILSCKL